MATDTLGTSYTDFFSRLASLNVTGVTRTYTEPPQQVNPVDCPIQYVRLPSGTEGTMTAQAAGGWPQMFGEIVILINAALLDTSVVNFASALSLMDALSTALRGANYLGKTLPTWSIRVDTVDVGPSVFWAVIASVRANG